MPITVNGPGGVNINFPDGTDAATINGVMQQHFGAPEPSANAKADTAGAVAQGMTDLPILGPMIQGGAQRAAAGIRSIAGGGSYSDELKKVQDYASQLSQAHPVAEGLGRVAGTVGASVPLAMTGPGAAMLGLGARTLPGQMGMGALSGAGIGGADAAVRGSNPLAEGGVGGLIGAALPPVLRGAGALASPLVSNISARLNPEGYAATQVARALQESGRTPAEIDAALAAANREGQGGVYTAADAMGNAGQRLLSTVARSPGEGRTAVVEALDGRQAGQGRRVASQLAEGFNAPQTAMQTERALTGTRDTAADTAYGAVRADAAPVDLSPAVAQIDMTLRPGLTQLARPQSGLASDSIESALEGIRSRLTDGRSMLTDFTAVQRVRGDLADQVQAAARAGQGNRARLLGGVLRQVDAAMEEASPGFRAANADFRQASRNIEAVDQGRTAAMRGRTEDTIPAFQGLTPEGQTAFRSGYVDPLIAQTQGAAVGVNKARPLLNDAFRQEAATIGATDPIPEGAIGKIKINGEERYIIQGVAPAKWPLVKPDPRDVMQRQLAREQTMFETRNAALGGSKTADNLADQAAAGIDPTIIAHALTGNHMGVMRGLMNAASNGLTGNTAAVRQQIARILLSRGDMPPRAIQRAVDQTMQRIQQNQRALQVGSRTAAIALTNQASNQGR